MKSKIIKKILLLTGVVTLGIIVFFAYKLLEKTNYRCNETFRESYVDLGQINNVTEANIDFFKKTIEQEDLFKGCVNYTINSNGKFKDFAKYELKFQCDSIEFSRDFYISESSNKVYDIITKESNCKAVEPIVFINYPSQDTLKMKILSDKKKKNLNSCLELVNSNKFNIERVTKEMCEKAF